MCLILGVGLVVVSGSDSLAPGQSESPLDDDEAVAQVVVAAERIVSRAHLSQATGGYSFQSCVPTDDAPYQATLYANFPVPEHDPARYLRKVTEAMRADGWVRSPVVGEHFGEKLTKDGVTALINRDDNPAWTEVGF